MRCGIFYIRAGFFFSLRGRRLVVSEKLDTAQSLADFLNISKACIRKYTRLTDIPRVNIGHAVRYNRQAVLTWLQQRQQKKAA